MGNRWIRRFGPLESGERFVVASTKGPNGEHGIAIDYWHVTQEHTYLYTFLQNQKYRHRATWDEALFRELEEEVHSPKPKISVFRFAVDDQLIFSDGSQKIPKAPPAYSQEERNRMEKMARKAAYKAACKEAKAQQAPAKEEYLGQLPAPFIVYARFYKRGKEYAWKLTPDKPKRQNIQPGDRVLVWTQQGYAKVTVSRIEPTGDGEQPKYRVKKKLFAKRTTRLTRPD